MTQAQDILTRILEGDLAPRAQGFMIVLPRGYRIESLVDETLARSYKTLAHPDVRRLSPEGKSEMIVVDAVRDAQSFLASMPSGDCMKTLVIFRADRMNESAANALLKPLEEPTAHTRLVLLTDNPAALPTTIRSRCNVFSVAPDEALAARELSDQLVARDVEIGKAKPQDLLRLADGDPTLAADICQHGLAAWLKKVETWLSSEDQTPPLPTLTGKNQVSLLSCAMVLQALFARASREEVVLKGWTIDRALRGGWAVIERSTDITRTGIDSKTRLHTILMSARAA